MKFFLYICFVEKNIPVFFRCKNALFFILWKNVKACHYLGIRYKSKMMFVIDRNRCSKRVILNNYFDQEKTQRGVERNKEREGERERGR